MNTSAIPVWQSEVSETVVRSNQVANIADSLKTDSAA